VMLLAAGWLESGDVGLDHINDVFLGVPSPARDTGSRHIGYYESL
jgi:hypothetical protein